MPTKTKPVPTSRRTISEQLRGAILDRGLTAYRLGRETGIDPGLIQRFINGERDIRMKTADALADALSLRLVEGARGRGRPLKATRTAGRPQSPVDSGESMGCPESGVPESAPDPS
jgi:transcriptional regulator with XRE-family HTH domain